MSIDSHGNVHQPKGAPSSAGGQFTSRQRADATASLNPAPSTMAASLARGNGFGPYKLSGFKSMNGQEGPAWTAKIKRGGTTIATVHQDGQGGETFVRYASREAREEFAAFVATDYAFPPFPGISDRSCEDSDVLDLWATELETAKRLRASRSRGSLPVLTAVDYAHALEAGGLETYGLISRAVDDIEGARSLLARDGNHEGALYFDGESWVRFP